MTIEKHFQRGFVQVGSLVDRKIRWIGRKRGFFDYKLLTRWLEIVGVDIAAKTQPVRMKYAGRNVKPILVVSCNQSYAVIVQMHIPIIIERINTYYGENIIERVQLIQRIPNDMYQSPITARSEGK